MNPLKRINKTLCWVLAVAAALSAATNAKEVKVSSPDGRITFYLSDQDKTPKYRIDFNEQQVIEPSSLGLVFRDTAYFESGFEISQTQRNQVKQTWQQPWGESKNIVDHHNELHVVFNAERDAVNTYGLRIRVFNDGVGFRYEVPKQPGLDKINITNELTEFVMEKHADATTWWIPTRGWNRYEYVYNTTVLREVDRAHTPFTMKLSNGVHVSIHEAALVDYAAMSLDQRRHGFLKADLAPWSDGVLVKKQGAFNTPWRTIQISEDATGLLNSHLILNLNEPNKLGDVSWVEPGKYVGIWWGMHIEENTWGSGNKHGATTGEVKRYMDFASKYGFDGVLVEGWNIGWDGN